MESQNESLNVLWKKNSSLAGGMTNDIPEEPQVDPLEIYGIIERAF